MIEQLLTLTSDDIISIYQLARRVKDAPITPQAYIKYLLDYINSIGFFVFRDSSGDIRGILHCESSHPIDPKRGFIMVSSTDRMATDESKLLLLAGEKWLLKEGCEFWVMTTNRNPKGFIRKYGVELIPNEYALMKKIG